MKIHRRSRPQTLNPGISFLNGGNGGVYGAYMGMMEKKMEARFRAFAV